MTWKQFKTLIRQGIGKENAHLITTAQVYLPMTKNRVIKRLKRGRWSEPPRPKIRMFADRRGQTWFGYYDINPFNKTNEMLLANVGHKRNRPPRPFEDIAVGYFYRNNGEIFNQVDTTCSWCWQQGCRLQWYPPDDDSVIIYNSIVEGKYGSIIRDVRRNIVLHKLPSPIYDVDPRGGGALTLNFSRLGRLRPGYGYVSLKDDTERVLSPNDDGVWRVNTLTGEKELLCSLSQLAEWDNRPSMKGAEHYINHLKFSPSGNRFMFFHLWVNNGRQYNRLIRCDSNGKNKCILTNEGTAAHYTWKSDEELLVTWNREKIGARYYLFSDHSDIIKEIGDDVLQKDGHPSYSLHDNLILTDTYPDKYGEQRLLLYTLDQNLVEIGRFFSPSRFRGEIRCDLHPRWDRTGRYVCIDSAQNGRRALYTLDLSDVLPMSREAKTL